MTSIFKSFTFFLAVFSFCMACTSTKYTYVNTVVDPTCGMKLNKSESYVCKYNGVKYYFDSYVCKDAFKSNPKNFLDKKCVPNDSIIDLVCGVKVYLSESYDYKTAGRVYHFHSHACKLAFKMNSEKFINNKCSAIH